jgi:superfamily II DNA/RNA helicase
MSENLSINESVEVLDIPALIVSTISPESALTGDHAVVVPGAALAKSALNSEDSDSSKPHKVRSEKAIDQAVKTKDEVKSVSEFEALGLAPELNQAVFDLGYTKPTTVQLRAIPLAMQDKSEKQFNDLMVSSQTGSGKTAAFLLPVLNTLLSQQKEEIAQEDRDWNAKVAEALAKGEPQPKRPKRKNPLDARNFKPAVPGALVLCPTRELAQQVAQDAIGLVKHCKGLRVATVVGGMPYAMQISKLQNANLVVATPGRLIDLQNSRQIQLSKVQFLVIDEADRMLDLGFADDLAQINELTRERRQTMMFSATFAPRIQQLASRIMRSPQRVQVDSPQDRHNNIKQVLFWADSQSHKRKLLDHWLRDTTIAQAIVFASTQIECDSLAQDLQQSGFSSVALHGALSQSIRNRRLNALREGHVQILVATDVAARGIDVPSISHVFNYGLPMKAEDYVHRIGRTGRAGRDGLAITFAEFRDRRKIVDIEHFTQQPLRSEVIPGLEPQPRSSRPPSAPARRGARADARDSRRDPRGASQERTFGKPAKSGAWVADARKPSFEGGSSERKQGSSANAGGFSERSKSGDSGRERPAFKPRFSK